MPDNEAYLLAATSRTPWNKGKLIGPNRRYGSVLDNDLLSNPLG
jgi:hypothetical protein